MPSERLCGNPLCGRPFTPARVDGFYCSSTCRGDGTRLRELLQGSGKLAEAVRAALHKRGRPKLGPGKRADTPYVVYATSGNSLGLFMVGFAVAHSREEAIRDTSADEDLDRFVAIPLRALRPYAHDGSPLGDPPPLPSS